MVLVHTLVCCCDVSLGYDDLIKSSMPPNLAPTYELFPCRPRLHSSKRLLTGAHVYWIIYLRGKLSNRHVEEQLTRHRTGLGSRIPQLQAIINFWRQKCVLVSPLFPRIVRGGTSKNQWLLDPKSRGTIQVSPDWAWFAISSTAGHLSDRQASVSLITGRLFSYQPEITLIRL